MHQHLRKIFINESIAYPRSGWRMIIFLLIATGCNLMLTIPVMSFLKELPGLPLQLIGTILFYMAITAATWLMLKFIDKRPFISVGLTFNAKGGRDLISGVLIGTGMMSVIFVIEYASGMVTIEFRDLSVEQGILIFFNAAILYAAVGYGEEFVFRGYFFQTFVEGTSKVTATAIMALVFALMHAYNPNVSVFGLINIGLAGVWLSIAYFKTQSLWLPIGLHFSWNFVQGFVFSLPVSGTTSAEQQIGTAVVSGPVWLTGGTFGPEGGALATVMLAAGTLLLYQWKRIRPSEDAWSYSRWAEQRTESIHSQLHQTVQSEQ